MNGKMALIAVVALAASPAAHAQQPTRTVAARCCRAPASTVVMLELADPISTKTLKRGDKVRLKLAEPLIVGSRVLLPEGTPAVGEVVDVAQPGFGGKGAKLVLTAQALTPPHKPRIPLKAFQLSATGAGHATAATALGAAGIGFAPLGFVAFAIHGGDVNFPAGTEATAKLAANVTLPSIGRASAADVKTAALPQSLIGAKSAIDVPTPPAGMGQVVFFRQKSLLGTGQWFNVREKGEALGKLVNGAWFVKTEAPGEHTYSAKSEPEFNDELKLKIDAGETYYVEGVLTKGVVIGIADLTPSDSSVFAMASKTLKPAGPVDQETPKEQAAK